MSFVNRTANDLGYLTETKTLPASATIGYSSEINAIKVKPRKKQAGQYVNFVFTPSAITGTNLDIALYGAMTAGGTKFLLLDALVADLTVDGQAVAGVIDVQAYPAPFYYVAWTADVNESANTIKVEITGDLGGSQS